MRLRRLVPFAIIALAAAGALARCNTCLLTRSHTVHDTPAIDAEAAASKTFKGRGISNSAHAVLTQEHRPEEPSIRPTMP